MRAALLVLTAATVPAVLTAQAPAASARAVASITPADVAQRVGIIAHDSMGGRNTPSPGLEKTAQYIAAEFQRFGLVPGGDDGTFIQHYRLANTRLNVARSGVAPAAGMSWPVGRDAVASAGATGPGGVSGPAVVIAGVPAVGDELDSAAVEGAVVFWIEPQRAVGEAARRVFALRRRLWETGAAAVVQVSLMSDDQWQLRVDRPVRTRLSKPWLEESRAPWVQVRDETAAAALAAHGFDIARARAGEADRMVVTSLADLRPTVTLVQEVTDEFFAPNTVGILEGSDPVLKNEYLVFSAHMDHVGTSADGSCRPKNGDDICNGADDDASGTVAVVELAEAFALLTLRPKRSIIFLTVSGEEKGLWGSEYFTLHPPVPMERMVANFNADMVGRNWKDTIVVIGREHSDLGATLARVVAAHPELHMSAIEDLWPEQDFYGRSDHFNFAKRGVPILFFFNGTHEDYHSATDNPDKIDAEKESRIAQLMFYLGLDVANAANRPKWNPQSYERIVSGG
ncbi:MAG: M20/M25/M40 family metallo-hydrolase [Gemmatimonadota bacterium]|nr:M20/M25/M40 family metallo-hydrolase [Gemmatimonadota bacterium]MDH3479369.1 M20/M25/M40 family metallo-hydrolase [Gemmatimonadota bacterium]MDH3568705.1 M20/M25/M40 family metallo-hydrolase [Gemmatimonadota bacterium]